MVGVKNEFEITIMLLCVENPLLMGLLAMGNPWPVHCRKTKIQVKKFLKYWRDKLEINLWIFRTKNIRNVANTKWNQLVELYLVTNMKHATYITRAKNN